MKLDVWCISSWFRLLLALTQKLTHIVVVTFQGSKMSNDPPLDAFKTDMAFEGIPITWVFHQHALTGSRGLP